MENIFSIFHYCVYVIYYKLHLLVNKMNPFWLLAELPFLKRRYEKLGVDIHKEVNKAFGDKTNGISTTLAGGFLFGILFLLIMGAVHLTIQLAKLHVVFTAIHFIVFSSISFIACYFYVFKNDKYLKYFKEFKKWPKVEKHKNIYLSLCFIIAVLCLFFGSFML